MKYGHAAIPRIGSEVIVSYLGGDIDQPIVTGMAYNPTKQHAYNLPESKTRSYWKDKTHKGDGFNEIRFESEKGKEEIFVHAQMDQNSKVENNRSEHVNVNKVESVGYNKASEIGNNFFQIVDGNMDLRVGPSNKLSYTPSGARDMGQGIGFVAKSIGSPGQQPKGIGNLNINVEKNKYQTVNNDHGESVGNNKSTLVKKSYHVDVGDEILIEAGKRITFTCGNSAIVLDRDGTITINGQKILQNADRLIELLSDIVKVN